MTTYRHPSCSPAAGRGTGTREWVEHDAPGLYQLLEVLTAFNMDCSAHKFETHMMPAVIAWREMLSVNACHFVRLGMVRIMKDAVNP
jgi:hypothetical protein